MEQPIVSGPCREDRIRRIFIYHRNLHTLKEHINRDDSDSDLLLSSSESAGVFCTLNFVHSKCGVRAY